jgi:UDP-4-amino-4-deoxy-L-arabinose formyltransferase/UDP-glucuronic acid dehydrogenase (UDP-4-keto-hexauronic acid decarboxylating)
VTRAILVGDRAGLPILLKATPPEAVAALMAASRRPHELDALQLLARDHGRPLLVQPPYGTVEYTEFLGEFRAQRLDVLLCCSYSMLIRPEMLAAINGPAVNIHPALLPRNRGPNPIQWAVIKGESVTGLTVHVMNEEFDTGPIIAQAEEPIRDEDTWVTLRERLNARTPFLLAAQMPTLLDGASIDARAQDEAKATRNPRLTPESPRIDFATMTNREVFNLIRAQVQPLRGAFIEQDGRRRYFRHYITLDEVAKLRARYT